MNANLGTSASASGDNEVICGLSRASDRNAVFTFILGFVRVLLETSAHGQAFIFGGAADSSRHRGNPQDHVAGNGDARSARG
jgi:hypothetical protein